MIIRFLTRHAAVDRGEPITPTFVEVEFPGEITMENVEWPSEYGEINAGHDTPAEAVISDWLEAKFDKTGGCIICDCCARFKFRRGPDGEIMLMAIELLRSL